jgi:hypothetical protein
MQGMIRGAVVLCVFVGGFLERAEAQVPSATALLRRADLVVKGKVLSVGEAAKEVVPFRMHVDAVLKGTFEGAELPAFMPPEGRPGEAVRRPVENVYGIFFLSRRQGGLFVADTSLFWLSLREGCPAPPRDAGPLERLRRELIFTSAGPRSVASVAATQQLGLLPLHETSLTHLKNLLRNDDLELRGAAIEALLHLNRSEALSPALDFDARVEKLPEGKRSERLVAQVAALRAATRLLTGEESIAALKAVLPHEDPRWRRSAAFALSRIPEGACVPVLVRALDDDDLEVRFHAVFGLGTVTLKQDPRRPTMAEFRLDQRKYLTYWKDWWKREAAPVFEAAEGKDERSKGSKP